VDTLLRLAIGDAVGTKLEFQDRDNLWGEDADTTAAVAGQLADVHSMELQQSQLT
jgi:ADP-ribosylglycohydrolase